MLLALLLSCSKDLSPGQDEPTSPGTATLSPSVRIADRVPTVPVISFTAPDGATSWVEYGPAPDQLGRITPSTTDTSAEIRIFGAKAGHEVFFRVVATLADGTAVSSEIDSVALAPAPAGLLGTVTASEPDLQAPGGFAITMVRDPDLPSEVVIYDRDGDVVWYVAAPRGTHSTTVRLTTDRLGVAYGFYAQTQDDELGGIYRVAFDGDSDDQVTHTRLAHHDFRELSDGNWAYLGLDLRKDQAVEGETANVMTDRIYEIEDGAPLGTEPVEIINWFDDWPYDPWWVCSHMIEDSVVPNYKEWTHSNSLMQDPVEPDRYYWVLSRYLDALSKIDRQTGRQVLQIGGEHATIPQVGGTWSHPHMSHLWAGGFALFNNNSHGAGFSSAQEWTFDGETAELVNEWVGTASMNGMADVVKLSNGNALVGWTLLGYIEERTPDDRLAWRLEYPGAAGGRVILVDNLYERNPDVYAP